MKFQIKFPDFNQDTVPSFEITNNLPFFLEYVFEAFVLQQRHNPLTFSEKATNIWFRMIEFVIVFFGNE